MRNEQGDIVGLQKVKPATASKSSYQDTLMQSEFLKKDDADLLLAIVDRVITERE